MEILDMVRYLNSLDGPHMSLRAIAPYLGVSQPQLTRYLSGQQKPKEETIRQMEKGMNELLREIVGEWKWPT